MSRQKFECPITKKTCIGCSVYRGRHIGLWADEESGEEAGHAVTPPSSGNGSNWVASFDAFVKDVGGGAAGWE